MNDSLGRLVEIQAGPLDFGAFLIDAENDGSFEGLLEFDLESRQSLPRTGWRGELSY